MSEDSSASPGRDSASLFVHNPRMSIMAIVMDVARHVLPLLSLYVFHGNFASYVLLTAFDLSLGLMLMVATRERGDVNSVDPRSRWLVMRFIAWLVAAAFLAFISAIIAIPIAMPAFIFGMITDIDWSAVMSHPASGGRWPACRCLPPHDSRASSKRRRRRGNAGTDSKGPIIGNLEQDRKQSLAAKAAQVTLDRNVRGALLRVDRVWSPWPVRAAGDLRRAARVLRHSPGHRAADFSKVVAGKVASDQMQEVASLPLAATAIARRCM